MYYYTTITLLMRNWTCTLMLLYGSYVNFSRAHVKFSCRNAILWCNKVNALYSVVRVIDHYCTGMFLLTLGGHVQQGLQLGLGRLCSNFGLFYAPIFCLFFFSFHPFFFRMCPFFSKSVYDCAKKCLQKLSRHGLDLCHSHFCHLTRHEVVSYAHE